MENIPNSIEKFNEELIELTNDFISISRDFILYESGWNLEIWKYKHSNKKFPKVFELLLENDISSYPETIINDFEKLLTKLRELAKNIKNNSLDEREKIWESIKNLFLVSEIRLWFNLPEHFKEIFFKAIWFWDMYFNKIVVAEANEAIMKAMGR